MNSDKKMFGRYVVFRGGCAAFHVLCLDETGISRYAVFYGSYAVFRRGGYIFKGFLTRLFVQMPHII